MKEVIFEQVGMPNEVLTLKEADLPEPKAHEVQIKVTARKYQPI